MKMYFQALTILIIILIAISPQFAETAQEVFKVDITIDISAIVGGSIAFSIYAILKK